MGFVCVDMHLQQCVTAARGFGLCGVGVMAIGPEVGAVPNSTWAFPAFWWPFLVLRQLLSAVVLLQGAGRKQLFSWGRCGGKEQEDQLISGVLQLWEPPVYFLPMQLQAKLPPPWVLGSPIAGWEGSIPYVPLAQCPGAGMRRIHS